MNPSIKMKLERESLLAQLHAVCKTQSLRSYPQSLLSTQATRLTSDGTKHVRQSGEFLGETWSR